MDLRVEDPWTNVATTALDNLGSATFTNIYDSRPQAAAAARDFFRMATSAVSPPPGTMVFIPGGTFQMGDALDGLADAPVHSVTVSAYYLQNTEVTKTQWDVVRAWGLNNGYTDLPTGGGKATNHPVRNVDWYSVVKYCNARSQMEGLTPCYTVGGVTYKTGISAPDCNWNASGYRLPTEAEWERAARGGQSGKRFPCGDTITHSLANYYSSSSFAYDVSPTRGYHPTYNDGVTPYTAPVGSFAPNGYGLYDMAGNLWEWCWDRYSSSYYTMSPGADPHGPSSGSNRVFRGGSWAYYGPNDCRIALRKYSSPASSISDFGIRVARSSVP